MNKLRIGVVGVGAMGSLHLKYISNIDTLELTAVCDIDRNRADEAGKQYKAKTFYDYREMFRSKLLDVVTIATPHYSHTPITMDAFEAGLHVLTEKPIAVHISDARKMIEAHRKYPGLKWAAMFQMRARNVNKKIKEVINSGEFGEIKRINFVFTDWFRSQSYYDSGTWRATWKGEGGGVLLNQSVHHLDLLQWFFGMPEKITAFCGIGKYHNIEVEDEVTAYLEFPKGLSAVITVSTGEAPGINRMEMIFDKGIITFDNSKITAIKNKCATSEFIKISKTGYDFPETENIDFQIKNDETGLHQQIISNLADSVLHGSPLIARGEEGLNSVMIANSILYSSLTRQTVAIPLDGDTYKRKLDELIHSSTFSKTIDPQISFKDFSQPYA